MVVAYRDDLGFVTSIQMNYKKHEKIFPFPDNKILSLGTRKCIQLVILMSATK